MNRINYNMKEHGFVGHLSIPEQSTKYGVIVIMGGEQSLLPGKLIADRFAALIPKYIGGVDNVILCSPTHVPFEGAVDEKENVSFIVCYHL